MGFSPRRKKKKDNDDADSYQSGRSWRSGRSGASSSSSKKKGLKKLGSIFGKKRRLRGKDDGSSMGESSNYSNEDAEIDLRDNFDPYARPDGRIQGQQEWIGGGDDLADFAGLNTREQRMNSAGGRGKSLAKITEVDDEDYNSSTGEFGRPLSRRTASKRRDSRSGSGKNNRYKHHHQDDSSSVTSNGSRSFFGRKQKVPADPLSLVVLLVEPKSLRFELLSLDFDLTPKRSKRSRRDRNKSDKNAIPELPLSVQDVLDQISPSALTDEELKKASGNCLGLIDRRGKIHFANTNLETACGARPQRACDEALAESRAGTGGSIHLAIPTYVGESHKDILLGFFASNSEDKSISQHYDDDGSLSDNTKENVAKQLELARPIFSDPNVIRLMEQSGYDLQGWKPVENTKKSAPPTLGKPIPPPPRKAKPSLLQNKALTGSVAIVLATILAWTVVAGGLRLLPSAEL